MVDERRNACGLEARDVVQIDVAEGALLPVAAVGERHLVPAAIGPQAMGRIVAIDQGQVVAERQVLVVRDGGEGWGRHGVTV